MTTVHHSPPPGAPPFAIYEDPEDQEPPSPSEIYEGDVSFHSEISLPGADDAMPSIEQDHQLGQDHDRGLEIEHEAPLPHRYSSSYTSRPSILSNAQSSRRTSGTSYISSLPSEISVASKPIPPGNLDSRYTPRKERPAFRNPSSVRALQMSSPPPLPAVEASRERLKGQYKLTTPSRGTRSESMSTTGSRRRSHRDSMQRDSLAVESVRHTPTPQQLPLVLLHVTILPMQMPYSHEIMKRVMPEWLVENYRILEEKLQDIILMRRGLLIPHPRDEYEVLEERILESLELKVPRLLKCGHFVAPEDDSGDERDEDQESTADGSLGRRSSMSGGTITVDEEGDWQYQNSEAGDENTCMDCHRPVKKPGKGVGAGTKRWDLKIYAANGLMRAGAWLAAWSEMESCDVEIAPWIPDDVRKALEKRLAEEQEAARNKQLYAAELKRRIEEEAEAQKKLEREADIKRRAEEIELQRRIEAEAAALHRRLEEEVAEKKRLEDGLYEKIEEAKETIRLEFEVQAMAEAHSVAERLRAMEETLRKHEEKNAPPPPTIPENLPEEQQTPESIRRTIDEVPLSTLLKNYIILLFRGSSNFFLVVLTALIVFLAMKVGTEQNGLWTLSALSREPVVITSTATMTATSVATLTVTEVPSSFSKHDMVETVVAATETNFPTISGLLSETVQEASKASESSTSSSVVPISFVAESAMSQSTASVTTSTENVPRSIETSLGHASAASLLSETLNDASVVAGSSTSSTDVPVSVAAASNMSQSTDPAPTPAEDVSASIETTMESASAVDSPSEGLNNEFEAAESSSSLIDIPVSSAVESALSQSTHLASEVVSEVSAPTIELAGAVETSLSAPPSSSSLSVDPETPVSRAIEEAETSHHSPAQASATPSSMSDAENAEELGDSSLLEEHDETEIETSTSIASPTPTDHVSEPEASATLELEEEEDNQQEVQVEKEEEESEQGEDKTSEDFGHDDVERDEL